MIDGGFTVYIKRHKREEQHSFSSINMHTLILSTNPHPKMACNIP
jgi:hypothetical protein